MLVTRFILRSYAMLKYSRILCNVINIYKKNRDKQLGKYDKFAGTGDDRDPQFRMIM